MAFTAKDVQALRQATGAGMMDAKRALEANDGDMEASKHWLREQGLAASAKRDDRENTQGVVALVVDEQVGALVELKCETDFVAASEHFKLEAQELARLVAAKGEDAVADRQDRLEDLKITLKEKIEVGRVVRLEAGPGDVIDSYLHIQGGRGVNGVLVVLAGGIPAAGPRHRRPHRLRPPEVPRRATTCPADVVEAERQTLEAITRNEGKPEQAIAEDRRGSARRVLQDRRPARPALRQGRQADDRPAARRGHGSSSSPRSRSAEPVVEPRWRRIVFKPSGEALAGPTGSGIDGETLDNTAHDIIDLRQGLDVDVAVVVGGGNFWRGRSGAMAGMDATQSDHIGMLGTVMNALALQDALERLGQPTRVQSAIEMPRIAEPYIRRRAVRHLEKGRVVIFAAGTGNPFFTTDTAAALRAAEIDGRSPDQGHPLRRRRRLRRRPAHQPRRRAATTRSATWT